MTAQLAWVRARPAVGAVAGVLALAVLARYGPGAAGPIAAFSCAVLVVLAVVDLETHRLPNRIVLPAAALVLAARLATAPSHWAVWLAASLGTAACFLLLALVYPAGLGMGDVKLMLLLGAALGSSILPALFVGASAGAVAAVALLVRDGAAARKRALPYGPFLAFGAIAIFFVAAP